MVKNLLEIDLQLFADEVEDAGANDVAETADPQEETSEDETVETSEEEAGDAEPEQSAEENARYAAARRSGAESVERKYQSMMAERDREIAAMCEATNARHPVTGQPITTWNDYIDALKIQQRNRQAQELRDKGVDPALIDRMVASNPTVLQAQAYMMQAKEQEQLAEIQRSVEEISKLDTSIKTAEDLVNAPYCNDLIMYCQRHNTSLADAYKILQFNNLLSNNNDAARQQAINQMKGKSHLPSASSGVATENDDVEVPAEIMARFKADGKTEKQIRELYKKVPH